MMGTALSKLFGFSSAAWPPSEKTPTLYPVRPRLRVGMAFMVTGLEGSAGSDLLEVTANAVGVSSAAVAAPPTFRKLRRFCPFPLNLSFIESLRAPHIIIILASHAGNWAAHSRALLGNAVRLEDGGDQGQGQTYNIEIAAFNAGNPARGAALDGVGACLVHGLAGGHVGFDFRVGEREKANGSDFGGDLGGLSGYDCNAGDDVMGAPREQSQHACGIGGVFGFGKDLAIEGHGGVGAENHLRWGRCLG